MLLVETEFYFLTDVMVKFPKKHIKKYLRVATHKTKLN
jgi:hypothetical protein